MRSKALLTAISLGLVCGCGEQPDRPVVLTLDQVPIEAREAAAKSLPQVKFDSAWKAKINGQEAYEIRGKESGGKIREVEVTPDGKVLAVE